MHLGLQPEAMLLLLVLLLVMLLVLLMLLLMMMLVVVIIVSTRNMVLVMGDGISMGLLLCMTVTVKVLLS